VAREKKLLRSLPPRCGRSTAYFPSHAGRTGVGRVQGSSAGYELPSGDTLEPDASFISRERFAAGPAPQSTDVAPLSYSPFASRSSSRRKNAECRASSAT
jgi:hypothetical protein